MLLPKDLLPLQYTDSWIYTKPRLFLCETDKSKICQLDTIEMSGVFKFNAYSELECSIGRTYEDFIEGCQKVNPFYEKIEALRLLHLEGFGYFEIQDPEIVSDGIKEVKSINAYSLEYSLSQKYLEGIYINTGKVNSVEVIYSEENKTELVPVTLYNIANPKLSLLHIILEKIYGWSIGHVDASLQTMSRTFEVSRTSVYDFIIQDICESFNCFAVFDTVNNTINFYTETSIAKFFGDGASNSFKISPPYKSLGTVSVDSYKTLKYEYNAATGVLILENIPPKGSLIEVTDGSQAKWMTDVYVSFDNLVQEVNVSYSADDIKTVLTVKGADDLGIEEVNMGLPYITDLSYYYNPEWMGQELYDAYTEYLKKCKDVQEQYTLNIEQILELQKQISYETNRVSLQYSIAEHVNSQTVGEYYVRGGTSPNYYYTKVSLPDEYSANVERYYSLMGNDLDALKVENLFKAIKTYYISEAKKDTSEILALAKDFSFMETNTIASLASKLSTTNTTYTKDKAVSNFLDEMFDQIGLNMLNEYLEKYKGVKQTNIEAGYSNTSHEKYWEYYPVNVIIDSVEKDIKDRNAIISSCQEPLDNLLKENQQAQHDLLLDVFFTSYYINSGLDEYTAKKKALSLLVRLSPFLREDEYTDDNFVITDSDTNATRLKMQQELLECGRIELSKLCEPKLEFSMDMANIYALPEFEPIVNQFQLGNLINIAIRRDYIKRARLLQVNINFDDFSDFSCEFGELTNLKTPSSIHADLLSQALSAGKSVASNASYWNKGADLATSTDLKIQQGLLSATSGLYTSDQSVTIDDNGILLRKVNENGEFSPYQAWLRNNTIMLSSDGFKTSRTGLGEFTVDGETFYGILAEAVLSGYIEGSKIVGSNIIGGTIDIGNGTFTVSSDGSVVMKAISIDGYVEKNGIISSINQSPESISINADKISLVGKTIDLTGDDIEITSTNFSVTKDGEIVATSGNIAGWTIYENLLRKETTIDGVTYQMYMQASDGVDTKNAFAVRKKNPDVSSWDVQFSVNYEGKLTAKNANITGTITAKDGSIAGYNIGSGGSYSNAIYKRVAGDGDGIDYEVGLKATNGDTDLAFYVKQSADDWASNSNVFYVRNNGQLYAKNADITGKITASSGSIGGCTISDGVLNVDAANIVSGTINTARIPNLSADKITAGTIHADRIPNISANKITSGTINASTVSVTNLNASNITSGTLSANRLSSSVITTDNFSSKTLSTSNLTVASGCRLGVASEYNAKLYSTGGYTWMEAFIPNSSYISSIMNIVRAGVNVASSKDIKSEIHDFDERYDVFFDKLNPQLFKYNFELDMGYSMGFIWEEAREAMDNCDLSLNDLGAIHESAGTIGGKSLRKDDFVALNTWQIQKLKARVEELEKKLSALEA